MGIKLSTKRPLDATGKSLLDEAIEIADARESLMACGAQMTELVQVLDNIGFIRSTVESNGVQWYIDNCDPENAFAHTFNVLGKDKEVWTSKADAAMEGIIGDIWETIKKWCTNFWNWIVGLFKSDPVKKAEETTAEAEKVAKENKEEKKEPEPQAPVPEAAVTKIGKVKKFFIGVKDFICGKKAATEALDGSVARSQDEVDVIDMPSLNKMVSIFDQAVPKVAELLDTGLKEMQRLVNKAVSGQMTCDEFEAACHGARDKQLKEMNEFGARIFGSFEPTIVTPNANGEVTFAAMKLQTAADAHKYVGNVRQIVTKMSAMRNLFKSIEPACNSVVRAIEPLSKKSTEDGAKWARQVKEACKDLKAVAEITTKMTGVAQGLSEFALAIETAIAKQEAA